MRKRAMLSALGWSLLAFLSAGTSAQQAGIQVVKARNLEAEFRASDRQGCVRTQLTLLGLDQAKRQVPVASTEERREVHILYQKADTCARESVGFMLELSEQATLVVRNSLEHADLMIDAPAVPGRRCRPQGPFAVCEPATFAVHLRVHWDYNGLFEVTRSRTRSRIGNVFEIDAESTARHLADMQYEFTVDGQPVALGDTTGSMARVTDATVTITSPAGMPEAALN